jgi:hypothetical protein
MVEVASRNTACRSTCQSKYKQKFYTCRVEKISFDTDVTIAVAGNQI